MLIQDTDFDPCKQDPNTHSLWLHVLSIHLYIFQGVSGDYSMRGCLLCQHFLFHRERAG